ncbi:MAG: squalene--hopene cyclase [Acidobacteria bacterium]|nr:squalene--hopene cyclase [Acidobacteriota bacterium]MCL5287627.1 squalene--hopene cyclase [Acidobacteriota bacterium]
MEEQVDDVVDRGVRYLLSIQHREGYWLGELEADTTLESDYILYLHILGKLEHTRVAKLANQIRRKQLADGGWNVYEGGPSELNATVKAYLALKIAGDSASSPHMARACACVHALNGLEHTNSFTRFYLALVGAVGWEMVPAVPPELMLSPDWFYLNIYEMSSWTRGIVIPLMILYCLKPSWPLPDHAGVDELFKDPKNKTAAFAWDSQLLTWRNFFLSLDRVFKLYERLPIKPFRDKALDRARQWLLDHLQRSDGLGAIYPAMMNSIFALLALGHPPDDPLTAREIGQLARFEIEEGDTIRLQPCLSPVWDTAIAMVALEEAGLPPDHPALIKAARWMLDQQILGPGDWQKKNRNTKPGGWAFEFRNDFYPDIDDTAFVLQALQRVDFPDRPRMEEAIRRGLTWMLSMQNRDGGWGAFDRDNDCAILTQVPFADHQAMIDPSTEDVTARVIECLGRFGWNASHPIVKRALSYLQREQCPDGSWYGRWGVNYVYGTGGVLRALEALGLADRDDAQLAAQWLRSVQNPDGGFGETCASYDDEEMKGKGPSTPSQTAWGLIGLLAAAPPNDPAVMGCIRYLSQHQKENGSWAEVATTGTGFPTVFHLNYHLYRIYFPLYALARFRNIQKGAEPFCGVLVSPHQFERRNGARVNR